MHERRDGRLRVYIEPNPNSFYAIGADVAEGLEHGDFSAAFVIDKELRQVASWHGHLDPDLFGDCLCRIGEYYNNALIAPEINNHGHTVLSRLKRKSYPNVFHRLIRDERGEKMLKKLGWQTNVKTKMLMLDEFVAAYRDKSVDINDVDLLKEMMRLTVEGAGNVDLGGKDRVVAAAIALQAVKQVTLGKTGVSYPTEDRYKHKEWVLPTPEEANRINKRRKESHFD